jgi:hypothetical protein
VYISQGDKVYWFDAVVKAQHTSNLKIEDDPANAKGEKYTNNATIEPKELALDIAMSDCISTIDDLTAGSGTRSVNAYQKLVELQKSRVMLGVSTRLFDYTRMLIKSIVAVEDNTNPEGLTASINLREVLEVVVKKKKKNTGDGNDDPKDQGDVQTQPAGTGLYTMYGTIVPPSKGEQSQPTYGTDGDAEVHYPK